ncbi:MAG: L-Ala--D-Glu endopeptidase [Gemmatimonadaceae bacterium]|nr:L-Ala--D-Glu endopeptidase [Gemmatimonadaceae bacterium]
MSIAEILARKALMVPIDGMTPEQVTDTYGARRAGGPHRALDLLAPRGTPVLSADAGRVLSLRTNRNGGTTVYAIDTDRRFIYYYAHLSGYRRGLEAGMPLQAGDVIGYVGTTGNAPPDLPHLHFQVMHYRPDKYWDGEPVNPFPFLMRSGKRRE